MRNLTPSDHMTGSAKRAVDAALPDATRRLAGGAPIAAESGAIKGAPPRFKR